MPKQVVFPSLSGLTLCLLCGLVFAAPTTSYAECDNIPHLQQEAGAGDAEALAVLGGCYAIGQGVAKDEQRGVELFRKAAEQDAALGQHNLGVAYYEGLGRLPRDKCRAAEWFRKAAEQGWPASQNNLARMYMVGECLPQDERRATEWFRKAAEQGLPEAQVSLGLAYLGGLGGLPKSREKAVEWYRKAAAQGNEFAQTVLRNLGEY